MSINLQNIRINMLHVCPYLQRYNSADFQENNGWLFLRFTTFTKKRTKSDLFASHLVQQFKNTPLRMDPCKCITFKVKRAYLIDVIKTLTKPNCNLCMHERLSILDNICDKHVTVMNKNQDIVLSCRHKTNFHKFCLRTDDTV